MWVCKLKLFDEEDIYTTITKKFNVTLLGYPISHYKKGKKIFLISCGILQGDEENKKKFLKDMRRDERIKKLDFKKDFLTILASQPITKEIGFFYNPAIIYIKPVINAPDGYEYWEIASWERAELMKLINTAIKKYKGELLTIKQTKLEDIFLPHIMPKLTNMQKKVIELAYKSGYYSYPRKTNIKKIARQLRISFATCQEHLRKAEIKLLPLMIEKIE